MEVFERQLLLCLSAYARGDKKAELANGFSVSDLAKLRSLAHIHKLTAVVYDKMAENGEIFSKNQEFESMFRRDALFDFMAQCAKTEALLALTDALRNADVNYVVVKGVICRSLYSEPDARISADEDLYVLPQEFSAAEAVLSKLGYVKGDASGNVSHWNEPSSALHIELHSKLMSKRFEAFEPYFANQIEIRVPYPVGTSSVYSFAPTANLVFMVSHAQKHFIAGGFGIRTLCDVALFAVKYQSEIDKTELYSKLSELNAVTFFRQILAIARDFLSIDTGDWDISGTVAGADLLSDILEAGVYGQSTMARRHSSTLTVAEAEHGKSAANLFRVVFPSAASIKSRYAFVNKHPWLLPVGRCKRIVDYLREISRSNKDENSPGASLSIYQKRSVLIKKYGITEGPVQSSKK